MASPSGSTKPPAVDPPPVSLAWPARRSDDPRPRTERWTSSDLFAGSIEIEIEHAGAVYRLRQTSLGKLILTK